MYSISHFEYNQQVEGEKVKHLYWNIAHCETYISYKRGLTYDTLLSVKAYSNFPLHTFSAVLFPADLVVGSERQ